MSDSTASAKATDDQKKSVANSKKRGNVAEPSLNLDEIRELAELVIEHGFTDFEFENENIRVRLSKSTGVPAIQSAPARCAFACARRRCCSWSRSSLGWTITIIVRVRAEAEWTQGAGMH